MPASPDPKDIDFYTILGLDRSARPDDAAIKKGYRKEALKWHPDKNPDDAERASERFKRISKAFAVLSDPRLRQRYDRFGEAGLGDGSGGSGGGGSGGGGFGPDGFGDPFDFFRNMFGRGGGGGGPRGGPGGPWGGGRGPFGSGDPFGAGGGGSGGGFGGVGREPRTRIHQHTCPVTLSDIYCKRVKHLRLTKQVVVDRSGARARTEGTRVCNACGGLGRRRVTRRSGYVLQQFEADCDLCRGKGRTLLEGYAVRQEQVTLDVELKDWARKNGRYRFEDTGGDLFAARWDTVVTIQIQPHPRFKRKGRDLITTVTLDWRESLFGFRRVLRHLDGTLFLIEEVGRESGGGEHSSDDGETNKKKKNNNKERAAVPEKKTAKKAAKGGWPWSSSSNSSSSSSSSSSSRSGNNRSKGSGGRSGGAAAPPPAKRVTHPGALRRIAGKGLDDLTGTGDLYVSFSVRWPTSLGEDAAAVSALAEAAGWTVPTVEALCADIPGKDSASAPDDGGGNNDGGGNADNIEVVAMEDAEDNGDGDEDGDDADREDEYSTRSRL